MMTAYRDDLEAARLRAADLQRELVEIRAHNQQLEAELARQVAADDERRARENPGHLVVTQADRKVASLVIAKVGIAGTIGLLWAHALVPALVALATAGGLLWLLNRGRGRAVDRP